MARRKRNDAPPTTGNLVVNNTQPRAIFLPPCVVDGERYTSRMLLPGQNDVPAEHFGAIKGTPGMRQYVALGYLEALGGGKAEPIPSGFDGMADSDVRERLAAIEDPQALIELRDLTTSPVLVRMCNERIRELTSANGDEGSDSE